MLLSNSEIWVGDLGVPAGYLDNDDAEGKKDEAENIIQQPREVGRYEKGDSESSDIDAKPV